MDQVFSLPTYSWREWPYGASDRKDRTKKLPIDILVGCPIQKREWIIKEWFWHAIVSCKNAGLTPAFIFVMDSSEEPLNTMIHNLAQTHKVDLFICDVEEIEREDHRMWNKIRYERMVELRNILLDGVRNVNPPLFLSLDSDILIHKDAVDSMLKNINGFEAIGSKVFMTRIGRHYPSYAMLGRTRNLIRPDSSSCFKVDVIMGLKLMKPEAYNVNYEFASQGEDIGWSLACKENKVRLAWDGSVTSKHVMRKQDLEKVDVRAGY